MGSNEQDFFFGILVVVMDGNNCFNKAFLFHRLFLLLCRKFCHWCNFLLLPFLKNAAVLRTRDAWHLIVSELFWSSRSEVKIRSSKLTPRATWRMQVSRKLSAVWHRIHENYISVHTSCASLLAVVWRWRRCAVLRSGRLTVTVSRLGPRLLVKRDFNEKPSQILKVGLFPAVWK